MQDSSARYLRHGQTPFFRLPASLDIANAHVALLGVPHDGGTTYHPGARLAPYHVRRVSELIQNHHPVHDHSIMTSATTGSASSVPSCGGVSETRPVYITFDIDAVDPAFAPGTGTPVPGGLTAREALGLVRGLAGLDVRGGDVVELCPALDHADITSHLAAHILWEMLALVAVHDAQVPGSR